ncbi:hypothetical protein [Bradyrhizobium sp.]|uniref:hypothetical protein n=1 Tax=Bradyrhizobium sp. TaxID=376 RepID=UPI002DDD411D|nr:hypothetical protein [Bradyrhizobium sp.]HEV2154017.1 hypothetical protein [Bradyrhizobium sp.]
MQYHVRMDLREKGAKAVKRMMVRLHGREIRKALPFDASIAPVTLARICPAVLCRRGTAAAHAIDAGLSQHISGI